MGWGGIGLASPTGRGGTQQEGSSIGGGWGRLDGVDPGPWQGSELVLAPPSNIPNRSTFVCPYCGARNLDQQELVKHCMENHRNDPNKVVSGAGEKRGWGGNPWESKSTGTDPASCCWREGTAGFRAG